MKEDHSKKELNLKAVSILIITFIAAIIIGIFILNNNNVVNQEGVEIDSIIEQIKNLQENEKLMSIGSISLYEKRVDYSVQRSSTKEKAVYEIFSQGEPIFKLEYYEDEENTFVYLPTEEEFVTFPYDFNQQGTFLDLTIGTIEGENIDLVNDNIYSWDVEVDKLYEVIMNFYDDELIQLFGDFNNSEKGLDNLITQPVVFKVKIDDDIVSLFIDCETQYGPVHLEESITSYEGEIDILTLNEESESIVPLEIYKFLR